MSIRVEDFGLTKAGEKVHKIILENSSGNAAVFIDFGAIWSNMYIRDKKGRLLDVVQGFDDVAGYEYNKPHLGSPIGRYANRIAGASFVMDGQTYHLEKNKGIHNLHSGMQYWDKRMWNFCSYSDGQGDHVVFSLESPDMDQGFPGKALVKIRYSFGEDNALSIVYEFQADKKTPLNLTNHAYFNLNGTDSDSILDHLVQIEADSYNFLDEDSVATEIIRQVEGTPLDFRQAKQIGKDIDADFDSLRWAGGYDQNFILRESSQEPYHNRKKACEAFAEDSGILMEVYTDMEGVQFYTANSLELALAGKNGHFYEKRSSFCFETGHLPNALNIPAFPSPYVEANTLYQSETIYRFSVRE